MNQINGNKDQTNDRQFYYVKLYILGLGVFLLLILALHGYLPIDVFNINKDINKDNFPPPSGEGGDGGEGGEGGEDKKDLSTSTSTSNPKDPSKEGNKKLGGRWLRPNRRAKQIISATCNCGKYVSPVLGIYSSYFMGKKLANTVMQGLDYTQAMNQAFTDLTNTNILDGPGAFNESPLNHPYHPGNPEYPIDVPIPHFDFFEVGRDFDLNKSIIIHAYTDGDDYVNVLAGLHGEDVEIKYRSGLPSLADLNQTSFIADEECKGQNLYIYKNVMVLQDNAQEQTVQGPEVLQEQGQEQIGEEQQEQGQPNPANPQNPPFAQIVNLQRVNSQLIIKKVVIVLLVKITKVYSYKLFLVFLIVHTAYRCIKKVNHLTKEEKQQLLTSYSVNSFIYKEKREISYEISIFSL